MRTTRYAALQIGQRNFVTLSGMDATIARQLNWDVRRCTDHDRRIGVGRVTSECFQKQEELLGKHDDDLTVVGSSHIIN